MQEDQRHSVKKKNPQTRVTGKARDQGIALRCTGLLISRGQTHDQFNCWSFLSLSCRPETSCSPGEKNKVCSIVCTVRGWAATEGKWTIWTTAPCDNGRKISWERGSVPELLFDSVRFLDVWRWNDSSSICQLQPLFVQVHSAVCWQQNSRTQQVSQFSPVLCPRFKTLPVTIISAIGSLATSTSPHSCTHQPMLILH